MCWTKWWNGKKECIGRSPSRKQRQDVKDMWTSYCDEHGLPYDTDELSISPPRRVCQGGNIQYNWVEDGLYSYDGHVCGFKKYIVAHCPDCGHTWVECPENYEEIQAEFGLDCDWREMSDILYTRKNSTNDNKGVRK